MPSLTIPDYFLTRKYIPENDSPNSNIFEQNNLAIREIPVTGLDNTLSWCSDVFQDFKAQIDAIVVDQIGVNGTAGQLLAFVNDDVLGAVNLQDALTDLGAPIIDGSNIVLNTVYGNSIRNASITPAKLIDGCATTPKIADGAITPQKIPANSIPFTKFVVPQGASVIGGTATNGGSWYELTLGNWNVVSKKPQNNGVTAVSLTQVWGGTAGTFDGAKITPLSLVLEKLRSGNKSCLLAGTGTDNAYYELEIDPWQIASRNNNTNGPIALTLDVIWSNTANSFDGAKINNNSMSGNKILDNSIPSSKLNNSGQMVPFAMAYILSDGTIQKSLNIASVTRTSTGYYEVRFNTQANDNKYIWVAGTQDIGSPAFIIASIAQNTRTVNGFDVETGSGTAFINGEFNFVVYAF